MPEPLTGGTKAEAPLERESGGRGSAARRDAEALHLRPGAEHSRPSRRKGPLWLVLLLALAAGGGGLWWHGKGKSTPAQPPAANSAAPVAGESTSAPTGAPDGTPETSLDGALGLALQGVSLFSGEKGAELWRLKASYAHLSREGNQIDVEKPVVRYIMGNPGEPGFQDDYLDVKSDRGQATDNQRYVNLWGNVDVRRFEETLTGPKMNYDSQTRILVFPEGATMDSPKATGEAAVFTWDLANNVMTGENGVTVVFKPQEEPQTPESQVDGQTQTPGTPLPVVAPSRVTTQNISPAKATPAKVTPKKTSQTMQTTVKKTGQKSGQKASATSAKKQTESKKMTTRASSTKKTTTQKKSGTSATKQSSSTR